jgi:uncharacterized protein YigE (DUF2233 family)
MFTLSSDALNWIARNARPRWLWLSVAVAGAGFSLWTAIPEKYQTIIIDRVVERVSKPAVVADLAIGDFRLADGAADDLVWLKTKIERNLVELFVDNGRRPAHRLTVVESGSAAHPTLTGQISDTGPEGVEIAAQFVDEAGATLASSSFVAPLAFLKENYHAIPEAIVYGLDLGYGSLKPLSSKARPTQSIPAYMLYLEARYDAAREDLDAALAHLDAAVALDPKFASAHGAAAEILRARGQTEAADQRMATADSINLDRTRLQILTGVAKPLPALISAVQDEKWAPIADGLQQKHVTLDGYGLQVFAWRLDPAKFAMRVVPQDDLRGTSVADLRADNGATLAVNGGFFDVDREGRLSPSGYLVSQGRKISELRKGAGSAVLFQDGDTIAIGWSKEPESFAQAADAVQAGPMVVDPGGKNGIFRNDYNRHDRTAVCASDAGIVVTIVKGGLSLFELGALLSAAETDGGFGCDRAINLDGGPSTQASLAAGKHALEIEGTWRAQNAVLFAPR